MIETGLKLGWIHRLMPEGQALPGEAAGAPPTPQVRNAYILAILEQAGGGMDPSKMTEAQIAQALARLRAESDALDAMAAAPSLEPGTS